MTRELQFLKEEVEHFIKVLEKLEMWIQKINTQQEEIKERLDNLETFVIPY